MDPGAQRAPAAVESVQRPRRSPGLQLAVGHLQPPGPGGLPGPGAPRLHRPGARHPSHRRDGHVRAREGHAARRARSGHGGDGVRAQWFVHLGAGLAHRRRPVLGRMVVRVHDPRRAGPAPPTRHLAVRGRSRPVDLRGRAGHPGRPHRHARRLLRRHGRPSHPPVRGSGGLRAPTAGHGHRLGRRFGARCSPRPAGHAAVIRIDPRRRTAQSLSSLRHAARHLPDIQRVLAGRQQVLRRPRARVGVDGRLRRRHRRRPRRGGVAHHPPPAGHRGLRCRGGGQWLPGLSHAAGLVPQPVPERRPGPVGPGHPGARVRLGHPGRGRPRRPGPLTRRPEGAQLPRGRVRRRRAPAPPGVGLRSRPPLGRGHHHPIAELRLAGGRGRCWAWSCSGSSWSWAEGSRDGYGVAPRAR